MDADKNVLVTSKKKITAMWDGKEYEIGKEPIEIKRGIAEHWQGLHEGIKIDEVPAEVIEQRTPKDPLEQNNRGTAFAGLKEASKETEGEQ